MFPSERTNDALNDPTMTMTRSSTRQLVHEVLYITSLIMCLIFAHGLFNIQMVCTPHPHKSVVGSGSSSKSCKVLCRRPERSI